MKKQEKENTEQTIKREKIGLYRQYPYEVIRETKADGSVDYWPGGGGGKLKTWEEEAEMTIGCMLERIDALAELFNNEDEMKYSLLLRSLVSETKRVVEDMFGIIGREIGTIECTYLVPICFSERGPCVGARAGEKAIDGKYISSGREAG